MNVKEMRRLRLVELLSGLPAAGRHKALATRIRKKPAQVSQWLSGYRTISEQSAREIESRCGLPAGWMDTDSAILAREPGAPYARMPTLPGLEAALTVVVQAIAPLPALRWAAVRAQLDQVVGHPEILDDAMPELLHLLEPASVKRPSASQ